jgi:thymidylate kinase
MSPEPTALSRLLTPLFSELEREGIRYCVLRGFKDLPEATRNDVDLAIDAREELRAAAIVERIAREAGWLVVGRTVQQGFRRINLFHRDHPGGVLPLDLCTSHSVWGMHYADADFVLDSTREARGFRIARPGCEAAVSLLKGLLRHGVVKARADYRERLSTCAQEDPEGFVAASGKLVGQTICEELVAACAAGEWQAIEARAGAIRRSVARSTGVLRVASLALAARVRTRVRARSRRNGLAFRGGLFICLLGPVGSGKTTLSRAIEERIGGLFAATEQYHSAAGVLPKLKGIKQLFYGMRGRQVPDSPLKGIAMPGVVGKPLPALRTSTYIVYYGFEYFLYRWIIRRKLRHNRLVIFDRYFYDYYLMRAHLNAPRWLLDLFARLVAQPDVLFVMLADPEAIFRRKPELTPEEIQRQQDILKSLDLPTAVRVDTSISVERTLEEVLAVVGPLLCGEQLPESSAS